MSDYQDKLAAALWQELKHVYAALAPADERTPEERKAQAQQDITELFGLDLEGDQPCQSKD